MAGSRRFRPAPVVTVVGITVQERVGEGRTVARRPALYVPFGPGNGGDAPFGISGGWR